MALAWANLDQAVADLAELTNGGSSLEAAASQRQVELAQAKLEEAEAELVELVDSSGSLEEVQRRKQLAMAVATLEEAEETRAEVLAGADLLEVALREAEMAAATASLEAAKQSLEDATLKAPWDGVITAVNMEVGDQSNAGARTIQIVDPTVVEIAGLVDEIDVLFIQRGARASVTMDALPGQTLAGTVSEIAAQPTTQQGIVSYPMSIQVQSPDGLELPEGLSAVASVVIREDLCVLLVPIDALYGTFEQPVVRVSKNGQIEERPVALGNNDDYWAVVVDGLVEAELIVMESERAGTGGSGLGALRGLFGGGPGGFGGGR